MTEIVKINLEESINVLSLANALRPHDVFIDKDSVTVQVYESNDPVEEITRLLNKSLIKAFVE